MFKPKYIKIISNILIVAFLSSCSSTYEITKRSEITGLDRPEELTVKTKDGSVYELEQFFLKDSLLSGYGKVYGKKEKGFNGSINLKNIKEVEGTYKDYGKPILITCVSLVILSVALHTLTTAKNFNNSVVIRYPSVPGGCNSLSSLKDIIERPGAAGTINIIDRFLSDNNNSVMFKTVIGKEVHALKLSNHPDRIELTTCTDAPEILNEINLNEILK